MTAENSAAGWRKVADRISRLITETEAIAAETRWRRSHGEEGALELAALVRVRREFLTLLGTAGAEHARLAGGAP